jgi:hypothetical protein
MSDLFFVLKKELAQIVIFQQHPFFLMYGYINNEIRIYNKNTGKVEKYEIMDSKVNSIHLMEDESMLLVGC